MPFSNAKREELHPLVLNFLLSLMKSSAHWPGFCVYHPATAAFSLAALAVGAYLQHVLEMAPCPLCILLRYAFLAIALTSIVSCFLSPQGQRKGAWAAIILATAGLGGAGWLLWVRAHPSVSCGVDKLQLALNNLPTAQWLPELFMSEGLCSGEWAPVLGVSVPAWTFIGFAQLLVFLLVMPRSSGRSV
jgi:disulfide bond formation protein DsbB